MDQTQKLEPYIEADGWYTKCPHCWVEVYPRQDKCHNCGQLLDWSWLKKEKDGENYVELESKM